MTVLIPLSTTVKANRRVLLDFKCTLPFFDLLLRLLDLDYVSGRRTLMEILQQLLERLLAPLSFAFDL
jgi:hypothetical protein